MSNINVKYTIITYFKLRENQNWASLTHIHGLIITYFKLRENQNYSNDRPCIL